MITVLLYATIRGVFMGIKIKELANGMKVLVSRDSAYPVVSLHVWVHSGSVDESDGMAGASHFIEHMIFKGTEKRSPETINLTVEGLGGDLNAYTTFDSTVYHLTMASRYWKDGLDVLSDIVQHPVFPGDGLEKERNVILEEIKEGEDNPEMLLSQKLFKEAYVGKTYGRPIIGYRKTVRSMTRESLVDYYRKTYLARNILLVACGDVPTGEFIKRSQKLFGDFPSEKGKAQKRKRASKGGRFSYCSISKGHAEHIISMGFRIPQVRHSDIPALDLLSVILGDGDSSRLNQDLVGGRALARDASSYTFTPEGGGLFLVRAFPYPDKIKECLSGIIANVEGMKKKKVGAEELKRAKISMLKDLLFQEETVYGKARKMGYFESVFKDPMYENQYIERIEKTDEAQLMRTAKKYLNKENLTLCILVPESSRGPERNLIEKLISQRASI